MKKNLGIGSICLLLGIMMFSSSSNSRAADAPAFMVSGLIMQMLTFEKSLMSKSGDLSIHVVGSKAIADELTKSIGTPIAKCKLSKVTQSNDLPKEKIDVLVIADPDMVDKAIAYTRAEKILSITSKPELVEKGVSLGIGMNETGGQSIIVNMTASKEEGLDWKPAILKIAKAVQ